MKFQVSDLKTLKIKRDLSTKDNREFWKFVDKTSAEIEKWPEWKKAGMRRVIDG